MKEQFRARMLRIHFGENDKWQGKPLHERPPVSQRWVYHQSAIVVPRTFA